VGIRENITPVHFEIMKMLEEGGTLHITQIGEKLQIPRPRMTQLIDKLVDTDMVERERNDIDRRTVNIMLSTKGKKFLKQHSKMIRKSMKTILSCLNANDLEDLSVSLRKLKYIFARLQ
jgi:DNA-binding MarR family transcriptional regulator